jgi:membrane protease YdiL (CAAX protease family)
MAVSVLNIIKHVGTFVTVTDIICLTGLTLFGTWLLKTSLGRMALADSIPRRNNMPVYAPFIPLIIWFGTVSVALFITQRLGGDSDNWQSAFLNNLIFCIVAVITVAVTLLLARVSFARGLKGFGLNVKTIGKDILAAVGNLLAIWPLLLLMILLTTFFGKLVWGQQYQIQQHKELQEITAHPQLSLRVIIIIVAVVVAPVLEEMIFRGLFQTIIRSFLAKPWFSILISSGIFVTIHQDIAHWPALFVLALCLGYAYEKSGSLFRPIFIHSLFNAITIAAVLTE